MKTFQDDKNEKEAKWKVKTSTPWMWDVTKVYLWIVLNINLHTILNLHKKLFWRACVQFSALRSNHISFLLSSFETSFFTVTVLPTILLLKKIYLLYDHDRGDGHGSLIAPQLTWFLPALRTYSDISFRKNSSTVSSVGPSKNVTTPALDIASEYRIKIYIYIYTCRKQYFYFSTTEFENLCWHHLMWC